MTSFRAERSYAEELDAADPLAGFRDRFAPPGEPLIYLDGNSLGRLPLATRARIAEVVSQEWGSGLVRSWREWVELPRQAGAAVAPLIGAAPGQVLVCDSTTVNLYKLASAALDAQPGRTVIVTDDDNFPTDRYVLAGLAATWIRGSARARSARRSTSTRHWSACRTWPTAAARWPTWR